MSKRSKVHYSLSPSSSAFYGQIDALTPSSASSKISKIEGTDLENITIFMESMSAWLNGYFFSKLSLENTQLPSPTRIENLELFESCNLLRNSIAKVREIAIKKISNSNNKLKDIPEKIKSSPVSKNKFFAKNEPCDEKKIAQMLENTLKDVKKKGFFSGEIRNSVNEKCEDLCAVCNNLSSEVQINKAKIKELEHVLESGKTRRIDDGNNLNLSKQSVDCNLIQVIYPLITRILSLQEKKKFYSLLYRHYERFLHHEEEEIRKLLDTSKDKKKNKVKLKVIFLFVYATMLIKKKSKQNEEKITIKGIKLKLLDSTLAVSNKSLSLKSLPTIISSIHKSVSSSFKERSILNSLISTSISVFQKFTNDVKTVLAILLKNNMEQKEAVITLSHNIKEIEEERDEIEGALTRTVEYTKNLEEEIMEMTGDPEYLRQIGEDTEMSLELESHKKALKGLTSQYNQLEHKMDELVRNYESVKKENEDLAKKLKIYDSKKN